MYLSQFFIPQNEPCSILTMWFIEKKRQEKKQRRLEFKCSVWSKQYKTKEKSSFESDFGSYNGPIQQAQ